MLNTIFISPRMQIIQHSLCRVHHTGIRINLRQYSLTNFRISKSRYLHFQWVSLKKTVFHCVFQNVYDINLGASWIRGELWPGGSVTFHHKAIIVIVRTIPTPTANRMIVECHTKNITGGSVVSTQYMTRSVVTAFDLNLNVDLVQFKHLCRWPKQIRFHTTMRLSVAIFVCMNLILILNCVIDQSYASV